MWTQVCKISEIEEGRSKVVETPSQPIALFKTGGKVYALFNTCPHRGGPLGEGYLEGTEVTCPWHAWTFDVRTGECSTMPGTRQPRYPVKVDGEDVLVDI